MKRKLVTTLVCLCLLIPTTNAKAQLDQIIRDACGFAGNIQGYEWICTVKALSGQVEGLMENIVVDFEDFAKQQFEYFLTDALGAVSDSMGLAQVDQFVQGISDAIRTGPQEIRTLLAGQMENFRNQVFNRHKGQYRPYSPDWWYEVAREVSPNLRAADAIEKNRSVRFVEQTIESEVNTQKTQDIAQTVAELSGAAEITDKVMGNPILGAVGFNGGDANNLRDSARLAISTRAGIRVLTEGIAAYMEQSAGYNQEIATMLQAQTQVQALTNYQMSNLVNTLTQEALTNIADRQAQIQSEINATYERGQDTAVNLRRVGRVAETMMGEDANQIPMVR